MILIVLISVITLVITVVTCLATADHKQPCNEVWGDFIDENGWRNKGIVF